MRKLSFLRKKRKHLDVGDKVIKQIVTSSAVPKSIAQIEMEKNYVMLAHMMSEMIDRMHSMENEMEKMQKKLVEVMRAKKKSKF